MTSPLSITGVGLVTPLGRTAADTWRALLDGQHITDHTRVEPAGGFELPRVASLAVEAATEAIRQAGWPLGGEVAVVACTSKGPVEEWIRPAIATSDNRSGGAATDLSRSGFGMGSLSATLSAHLGFTTGPHLTVCAACAGGLQALIRAALLLRNGEARRVLVVAAEASIHPLFLASFRRLGVLPPPGGLCRPFDVNRDGFLMGESAAAVCLEAHGVGGRTLALLQRFATGGDAVSLTGSDPHAETLCRIIAAICDGDPFDLVHAHGTATAINDAAELTALHRTLPNGGAGATLFSHKGALGHALGASGLVATVLNVLAHNADAVPPNPNTATAMATPMRLMRNVDRRPVRRSLACAAGFGGGITAVSLNSP